MRIYVGEERGSRRDISVKGYCILGKDTAYWERMREKRRDRRRYIGGKGGKEEGTGDGVIKKKK